MIRLFASIYGDLRNLFSDLVADRALNINGCTEVEKYDSADLSSAVAQFHDSEAYYSFCERFADEPVYTYNVNDDGTACRID